MEYFSVKNELWTYLLINEPVEHNLRVLLAVAQFNSLKHVQGIFCRW
jgi:hypothetical protein